MPRSPGSTLTDEDSVFCQIDGKPLLRDSITRARMKLAGRAGLKGVRLHDARHTHASIMLKQDVHPKIVRERLRHANIQIALDTCSHAVPGLQQVAGNHFDGVVLREIAAELRREAVRNNCQQIISRHKKAPGFF